MAEIYPGCTLDRLPHPKGAAALRFFEYAPRAPLPTLATLARSAKQLPSTARRALLCPRSTWMTPKGPLRECPERSAGLDWIRRAADILAVQAIVVATGAELSTGARDRTLLASFVEELKTTGRLVVIAPRGLWEAEHGAAFARQTGTVYGFDPLEDDAPEGDVAYARIHPMGARPRLTEGHLAMIAERLLASGAQTTYAAIQSGQAARDAKRLAQALSELDDGSLDQHSADEGEPDEEDEHEEEDEPDEG